MKYKGELEGFPQEIVERMLDYQVEQGNKRDVSVFEEDRTCGQFEGAFDWYYTVEKDDFWDLVLVMRDFGVFFERYPRSTTTPRQSNLQQFEKALLRGIPAATSKLREVDPIPTEQLEKSVDRMIFQKQSKVTNKRSLLKLQKDLVELTLFKNRLIKTK